MRGDTAAAWVHSPGLLQRAGGDRGNEGVFFYMICVAWRGVARPGEARRGKARRGTRSPETVGGILAWLGTVWQREARRDEAWQGTAWLGKARSGETRLIHRSLGVRCVAEEAGHRGN